MYSIAFETACCNVLNIVLLLSPKVCNPCTFLLLVSDFSSWGRVLVCGKSSILLLALFLLRFPFSIFCKISTMGSSSSNNLAESGVPAPLLLIIFSSYYYWLVLEIFLQNGSSLENFPSYPLYYEDGTQPRSLSSHDDTWYFLWIEFSFESLWTFSWDYVRENKENSSGDLQENASSS